MRVNGYQLHIGYHTYIDKDAPALSIKERVMNVKLEVPDANGNCQVQSVRRQRAGPRLSNQLGIR